MKRGWGIDTRQQNEGKEEKKNWRKRGGKGSLLDREIPKKEHSLGGESRCKSERGDGGKKRTSELDIGGRGGGGKGASTFRVWCSWATVRRETSKPNLVERDYSVQFKKKGKGRLGVYLARPTMLGRERTKE